MTTFSRPVTPEQNRRFGLAVCKRLGLDPELVAATFTWSVVSGEDKGSINFTVHLPAQEVLDLWNGAAPVQRPGTAPLIDFAEMPPPAQLAGYRHVHVKGECVKSPDTRCPTTDPTEPIVNHLENGS